MKKFLRQFFRTETGKWLKVALLVIVIGVFFALTSLTSVEIFFWVFFLSLFLWNIDARMSIGLALLCLVLISILLSLEQYAGFINGGVWAEEIAIWAFYFLVIGVTKQIWEMKTERDTESVASQPVANIPKKKNESKNVPLPNYSTAQKPQLHMDIVKPATKPPAAKK